MIATLAMLSCHQREANVLQGPPRDTTTHFVLSCEDFHITRMYWKASSNRVVFSFTMFNNEKYPLLVDVSRWVMMSPHGNKWPERYIARNGTYNECQFGISASNPFFNAFSLQKARELFFRKPSEVKMAVIPAEDSTTITLHFSASESFCRNIDTAKKVQFLAGLWRIDDVTKQLIAYSGKHSYNVYAFASPLKEHESYVHSFATKYPKMKAHESRSIGHREYLGMHGLCGVDRVLLNSRNARVK